MEKMKLSEAMELGFLGTIPTLRGSGPGSQERNSACAMQAVLVGVGLNPYAHAITKVMDLWPETQSKLTVCSYCEAAGAYPCIDGVISLAVHINDNHGGRQVALEYVKEVEASMTPPEIPEEHVPQEQEDAVESNSEVFSPEREEELVPA